MIDAIQRDGNGPFFKKDPRAKLPVTIDWSAWLTQEGTTIQSSAWVAEAGITTSAPASTTTAASVLVEGGTADTTYVLRNTITCANGVIDSRSIRVQVRDR